MILNLLAKSGGAKAFALNALALANAAHPMVNLALFI